MVPERRSIVNIIAPHALKTGLKPCDHPLNLYNRTLQAGVDGNPRRNGGRNLLVMTPETSELSAAAPELRSAASLPPQDYRTNYLHVTFSLAILKLVSKQSSHLVRHVDI